jgi:hypothetical protein
MRENTLKEKSKSFAIKIVNLYKLLISKKKSSFYQGNFYEVVLQLEQI